MATGRFRLRLAVSTRNEGNRTEGQAMRPYTLSEAAQRLGVTPQRVGELISLGRIKAEKPGREWQVDRYSVDKYEPNPIGRPRKEKI